MGIKSSPLSSVSLAIIIRLHLKAFLFLSLPPRKSLYIHLPNSEGSPSIFCVQPECVLQQRMGNSLGHKPYLKAIKDIS